MKSLLLLSFVAGAAVAVSPPRCNQGWACVENYECIDGVIDTSGAGKFDLRGYAGEPAQCSREGYVCCQIPQRTVQPACFVNEDCVERNLCSDGYIVTDGAGLIDLRLGLTEYRECYNAEYDHQGICCRLPDAPKPVDTCADGLVCTGYDFCGGDGTVVETILDVPAYGAGQACYMTPGVSYTTGVCCRPAPLVEPCPQGESCLDKSLCGIDGHISQSTLPQASWYQGQDCYIGFSKVLGTCCKPPKPVEHCPPGGQCTPYNYCSAEGQLTPAPHSGPSCADCLKCKVGLGSDSVGVCCGPPPKLPDCAAGNVCTVGQYCDAEGYVVSQPAENIYASGAQCNLPGGFGYGTCCNPVRPRDYCPLDSECVPADFCVGSILEQGTEDTWHGYGAQKEWHRCSLPGSTNGGICCKNAEPQPQQCGRSYYASQNINTRFYDPELDKLEADFGELPWQAIVFYSNYTFKCGASLISDKHLLTVAHCVNGLFPYDLRIRLGEWQVNTFDEPLQYQDKDVAAIHIHPNFRRATVWNNIAILELKQPVNFQYNINSICLPTSTDVYARFPPGTRCLASGWGKDSFSGTYQHILKKIDLPLVSYADCQNKLRRTRLGRHFRLHKSYTCAGGEEGRDACVGDGGGPLVCYDATAQQYVQVGITAWGVGCGTKDVPGAYTDVSKFSDWIYEIIALGNNVKEW